jgi:PAS domain S-box-containing protein
MSERKRPDISSSFPDIDEHLRVAEERRPHRKKKEKVSVPIEHILNGVAIIDRNFEIVETNKACLETLDLKHSEVVGRKCHEIFSSECCHGNRCALRRVLAGEKQVQYELRKKGPAKDGILIRAGVVPIFDPDGDVLGIVANFQNVTEQKRTEQKTLQFGKLMKQMQQEQSRLKKSIQTVKADSGNRRRSATAEYEALLTAQEELRVAEEELRRQNEQLENALLIVENEREKYQRLFEFTPFGYIVTDGAGIIQELNANAVRLFKLSRKLLVGKPLLVFFSKEDRKEFHRRLVRLQRGEDVREWECSIQPRKKRQIPVAVTAAAVSSERHEPLHVHWLVRDISETKKIQEELRRKTGLFERLVNSSSVGIMAFDKEYRVALWNPTMERLSGLKEEYLLNKKLLDLFPLLKERGDDKYLLKVLSGKTGSIQNRYFAAPEKGIEGFYDAEYSPLLDDDGQILGGLVIVRNTTKRKQAEEALRQSEEKYRTLFENSVLGIFTVDLHGRYTSLNPAALRFLGYSLAEIIGESYRNHIAPEFLDIVFHEYNKLFKTGRPIHNLRYDIITRNGQRRTIESSVSLLYAKDQPIGFQSNAIDITGRKQAEEIMRLSHLFLQAANKHSEMEPLLEDFIHIIKDFAGCESVGIRVFDMERRTHQVYSGFTKEFFESTCPLSNRETWCFCQLSTEGSTGYFDVCKLSETQESTTKETQDLIPPCRAFGFHAAAAVPIRVEQRLVGLIQIGISTRPGLQENTVTVLEHAVNQIGSAIVRIQMNETVKLALQVSHRKAKETSALLEGSRAVLEHGDFQEAAAKIVSVSRRIVGAALGCITLMEFEDDSEKLIAIDSDQPLPEAKATLKFSAEGICAEVFQSRKSIFINGPNAIPRLQFVEKKMKLQNALIVPILFDEKVAGLLLLFNKAGAFCDEDRDLIEAFAAKASIALRNSNHIKEIKRSEARYRWLSEGLEVVVKKKVTELQQAKTLASIGQMVSIVAHEIRNPLQNIFMGVDSLKREIGDDPVKTEILAEIAHGVRLLNGIVRELLDYSKPVNLVYSFWSIGEIIGTSLSLLNEKLPRVELHEQVNDPQKVIFLDGEKISRVLVNLLNNAIEAMPDGGALGVSSEFGAFSGFGLKISISDTGCGMDEQTLARIEEPFYTTKTQGTGLGVSICKKIVEAHGGSMNFRSEQNKGTTVDVYLPVREKLPEGMA